MRTDADETKAQVVAQMARQRAESQTNGDESPGWRRPTSCADNTCVEVAILSDLVLIKNGPYPERPILVATHAEWATFIQAVKAGEYDLPGA